MVTYFNVISSFYSYTGGVYPAAGCPTNAINHGAPPQAWTVVSLRRVMQGER